MRLMTGLAALALLGCNKDPGGNGAYGALLGPKVTFTSEGAGPENELPLEPMLPGFEATTDRSLLLRWSATVDAGRDDVTFAEFLDSQLLPASPVVSGDTVGSYRTTRDGVLLYGANEHLLEDAVPVLLVPDKVRVGMSWESEREDGSVILQTVVGHQPVQLSIGTVEAWAIRDDASGYVRWYAEGVGRVAPGHPGTEWVPEYAYSWLTVPETAQPGVELALDPVELRPYLDPFGHTLDLRAPFLFGLSSAVRDDGWWLYTHGFAPSVCPYCSDAPADYCVKMGVVPEWYRGGEHEACPELIWEYNGDDYPYTMVSANSLMPGQSMVLPDDTTRHPAPGEGGSDGERIYTWNTPDGVRCLTSGLVIWTSTTTPCDTLPLNINGAPDMLIDEISHRSMFMNGNTSLVGVQFIGPISTPAADAPLHLAAIDTVGRVFQLSVEDGRIHGFVPVGVISGHRTVFVTNEAREGWSITKDGRIFRVRVDATSGDVAIESLGDVAVADRSGRYTPVGVAPDPNVPGDVIVAVAAEGVDRDGSGLIDVTPRYKNTLFHATLTREPVPVQTPPSLLLGVRGEMDGRLVCWPETDAPFDAEGWLLGGKPPARIFDGEGPGGNCALLVPDGAPDPAFGTAITANAPGVGKVRIGTDAFGTYGAEIGDAALLRDGTLIDEIGQRFDEHGVFVGMSGSTVGLAAWPKDLGGYGHWLRTYNGPTIVHNLGGGIPSVDCGGRCDWWGAVEGGGLRLRYEDGHVDVVRPDGVTALPVLQQSMNGGVLLRDGRICQPRGGFVSDFLVVCLDAAGIETRTNTFADAPSGLVYMWPVDGGFVVYGYNGDVAAATYFFDPDAMTLVRIADVALFGPITAADGEVFGVATWYDPTVETYANQIVKVTATSLEPIEPSSTEIAPWAVVPLADELLISGPGLWHRIPR